MDKASGFGPVDRGSNPLRPIMALKECLESLKEYETQQSLSNFNIMMIKGYLVSLDERDYKLPNSMQELIKQNPRNIFYQYYIKGIKKFLK